MTPNLSGLGVEYALALLYSSESGKREATIGFDVGQGTQDLGFRGEVPVLFEVRPAIPVRLRVRDHDGTPTVAHFTFVDRSGRVYPPQPKRTSPPTCSSSGRSTAPTAASSCLPPGRITRDVRPRPRVPAQEPGDDRPRAGRGDARRPAGALDRPDRPTASTAATTTSTPPAAPITPTRRRASSPADMFLQVKGEGLNVGCVLTWGPCYDYQRQFFGPRPDGLSEPLTVIKYDVEVSGFGSQALGHVCLLNLRDQTYPGSDGTATKGWPTWTTPVLRWAKAQGAVTGYAHSGSGLEIDPKAAAQRLMAASTGTRTARSRAAEARRGLLPADFAPADTDSDGVLTRAELEVAHERAAETLPNLAIPEMNGVGAMEVVVSVPQGVCDFISAMDTPRIAEWNCGITCSTAGSR